MYKAALHADPRGASTNPTVFIKCWPRPLCDGTAIGLPLQAESYMANWAVMAGHKLKLMCCRWWKLHFAMRKQPYKKLNVKLSQSRKVKDTQGLGLASLQLIWEMKAFENVSVLQHISNKYKSRQRPNLLLSPLSFSHRRVIWSVQNSNGLIFSGTTRWCPRVMDVLSIEFTVTSRRWIVSFKEEKVTVPQNNTLMHKRNYCNRGRKFHFFLRSGAKSQPNA